MMETLSFWRLHILKKSVTILLMTDGDETQIRVSQLPLKSPRQWIAAAASSSSSRNLAPFLLGFYDLGLCLFSSSIH